MLLALFYSHGFNPSFLSSHLSLSPSLLLPLKKNSIQMILKWTYFSKIVIKQSLLATGIAILLSIASNMTIFEINISFCSNHHHIHVSHVRQQIYQAMLNSMMASQLQIYIVPKMAWRTQINPRNCVYCLHQSTCLYLHVSLSDIWCPYKDFLERHEFNTSMNLTCELSAWGRPLASRMNETECLVLPYC